MNKSKLSFDELSKKADKLSQKEQLNTVGGRRGRGGNIVWSSTRGGIIEDDLIIRLSPRRLTKG